MGKCFILQKFEPILANAHLKRFLYEFSMYLLLKHLLKPLDLVHFKIERLAEADVIV